jgi:hypothetical protein
MEIYEGGQYRIDIVGSDSSLIVDSNTGTIRANIANHEGDVLLDLDIAKMYGSLQGNIFDTESNIAYNASEKTFHGTFDGALTKNGLVLINQHSSNVPLADDIYGPGNLVAYDRQQNKFYGNFVGNVVDNSGNVLLATDTEFPKLVADVQGNVYDNNGVVVLDVDNGRLENISYTGSIQKQIEPGVYDYAYNQDTDTFKGKFHGNIIDESQNILLDVDNHKINVSLYGHIRSLQNNNIIYNADTETFAGNVSGDIIDEMDSVVLNTSMRRLSSSVYDSNGNVLLDYENRTFYGTVTGVNANVLEGDIVDGTDTIFTVHNRTFLEEISGSFVGSFKGNLLDGDNNYVFDYSANSLNAGSVNATTLTGHHAGTHSGNYTHTDGVLFDATLKHWSGVSLNGNIFADNGLEVFDATANTLSSQTVYADTVVATSLDLDTTEITSDGISVVVESAFSMPALTGKFYRATQPNIPDWYQQGIRVEAIGGSWLDPLAVTAGTKLPALAFNAAIAISPDEEDSTYERDNDMQFATVAGIYAKIPDDAVISTSAGEHRGAPGELIFATQSTSYGSNYMIFDANGQLAVDLKDFKVHGETGVTPSDTSTPDSWLQATVNGETRFIPLYS